MSSTQPRQFLQPDDLQDDSQDSKVVNLRPSERRSPKEAEDHLGVPELWVHDQATRRNSIPAVKPGLKTQSEPSGNSSGSSQAVAALRLHKVENRFLGTQAAAEYSGIPAGTLRAWRCLGIGPKFYKPRGRALYDIADLDDFIRSGIRVSSVRARREERNVYLPTG